MAKPPLPPEVAELLEQPNPAVITSVRPDGHPVSVATWYVMDEGRVLVNMDASRKRIEYMKSDPRVTLTALKDGDWYTHVSVQGKIVEWRDDPEHADIDRISEHYSGQPYPDRRGDRISAFIEIETWHGWGAVKQK